MKKTQQKVKSLSTKHHTDMNYILNSNTSYSTIPQQQSAKDRMCHILMAVPDVGPVCCRCIGISYSGCVTTPAYSCILLCRILEGTYNRKPVLKCTTGLFEFVVPSWFVRLHSRKIRVIYNKLKTTMEDRQLQLHQLLFSCNLLSTTPPELYRDIKIKWYLTQWYWERIKTASRFYEHIDKREIVNKAAVKLLLPND